MPPKFDASQVVEGACRTNLACAVCTLCANWCSFAVKKIGAFGCALRPDEAAKSWLQLFSMVIIWRVVLGDVLWPPPADVLILCNSSQFSSV